MKGLLSARHEREEGDSSQRIDLRRAQWSSYFPRFFGEIRTGDAFPSSLAPVSLDASAEALTRFYQPKAKVDRAARYLVRRCVSQMLMRGYRPTRPTFSDLMERAAQPTSSDGTVEEKKRPKAMVRDFLVDWGKREFDLNNASRMRPTSIAHMIEVAEKEKEVTVSLPTSIVHDAGAFTFVKEVGLRQKLDKVHWLVNPINWEMLGEFFTLTQREENKQRYSPGDHQEWDGVLVEHFTVSWNGLKMHTLKQKLKVDYTVMPTLVRTDYALMYEEDDQLELNEGYFQVEQINKEWLHGKVMKKLKFKSSVLNMLSPAIFAMFLESKAGGFGKFVDNDMVEAELKKAARARRRQTTTEEEHA